MSYKTTIPNPGDFLAISQKQILANYQAIYKAFSTNHVALDSIDKTPGNHTSFTMRNQSVDPTTGSTEVSVYNKNDASSSPQLFFRPFNDATSIQMTNSNSSVIQDATQFRQSTFLPGPFTLYVGYLRDIPVTGQHVTLSPNTNLLYVGLSVVVQSNPTLNFPTAVVQNISGNTFDINFFHFDQDSIKVTVYYMAIGTP